MQISTTGTANLQVAYTGAAGPAARSNNLARAGVAVFRPDLAWCIRDQAYGWVPLDPQPDDAPPYVGSRHLRGYDTLRAEVQVAGDGRTLEGIASPFDQPTVIDSWHEGRFVEIFRKGAYARTIDEDRQIVQFDHGGSPITASLPLGPLLDIRETDEGLYYAARLRDTPRVNEIREAIADGSLTGQSVQFWVREERRTDPEPGSDELPIREVLDVRLAELGPVVWPAYDQTWANLRIDSERQAPELSPDGTGVSASGAADVAAAARLARLRLTLS